MGITQPFSFMGPGREVVVHFKKIKKGGGGEREEKKNTKPSCFLEKPSTSHPKKSWMPYHFPARCGCRVVMPNVSQGSAGAVEWGFNLGYQHRGDRDKLKPSVPAGNE